MNSAHPTYPNPTITEAVCDIHFRLPQEKDKNHALIQLLISWREGDEQEQQNTWEYLK